MAAASVEAENALFSGVLCRSIAPLIVLATATPDDSADFDLAGSGPGMPLEAQKRSVYVFAATCCTIAPVPIRRCSIPRRSRRRGWRLGWPLSTVIVREIRR
jgi:hypothetical protein